jgi:hypothetical protein
MCKLVKYMVIFGITIDTWGSKRKGVSISKGQSFFQPKEDEDYYIDNITCHMLKKYIEIDLGSDSKECTHYKWFSL